LGFLRGRRRSPRRAKFLYFAGRHGFWGFVLSGRAEKVASAEGRRSPRILGFFEWAVAGRHHGRAQVATGLRFIFNIAVAGRHGFGFFERRAQVATGLRFLSGGRRSPRVSVFLSGGRRSPRRAKFLCISCRQFFLISPRRSGGRRSPQVWDFLSGGQKKVSQKLTTQHRLPD